MREIRPNNKVSKFYNEVEFDLDIQIGREWIDGDNNFKVILYQVDKNNTTTTDIYNEADIDQIQYKKPVELSVLPNLQTAQNKSFNSANGSMRYNEDGDFSFIIYEAELREKGVEISFGDFIGYDVEKDIRRYFEVIDEDSLNFGNTKTIMGYKRFYKTIRCKTITPDVFNGI